MTCFSGVCWLSHEVPWHGGSFWPKDQQCRVCHQSPTNVESADILQNITIYSRACKLDYNYNDHFNMVVPSQSCSYLLGLYQIYSCSCVFDDNYNRMVKIQQNWKENTHQCHLHVDRCLQTRPSLTRECQEIVPVHYHQHSPNQMHNCKTCYQVTCLTNKKQPVMPMSYCYRYNLYTGS